MSRAAVQQPYLFPYLGYFSLVAQCDAFVLMDRTQFIRRGWIHRNYVPGPQGERLRIGVDVTKAPQATPLDEIRLAETPWRDTLRRTLRILYARAPYRDQGARLLEPLWEGKILVDIVIETLRRTADYLGYRPKWIRESTLPTVADGAAERLLGLARLVGATHVVNLPGGAELYDPLWFEARGVPMSFVKEDRSWSVLHEVMTSPPETIRRRVADWGRGIDTPCTPEGHSRRESANEASPRPAGNAPGDRRKDEKGRTASNRPPPTSR